MIPHIHFAMTRIPFDLMKYVDTWNLQKDFYKHVFHCIPYSPSCKSVESQEVKYLYPSSMFFNVGESKEVILSWDKNPILKSLWHACKYCQVSLVVSGCQHQLVVEFGEHTSLVHLILVLAVEFK